MSSRKRPLTELRQSSFSRNASRSMPNTPSRYAPSTPHALRALQQRSAGKTRSARTSRMSNRRNADGDVNIVRPDSARGILRRLAKITAQTAKTTDAGMRALSEVVGKENVQPENAGSENDGGERERPKKPRLTLDIEDESLDFDVNDLPLGYDEEEDSELLAAPTPSILPDDDDYTRGGGEDRSVTFKTIDFTNAPGRALPMTEVVTRRKSRLSFAQLRSEADGDENDDDDDPTMLTERGRRAMSEEVTGRLSRYSFGSIRMSDFGDELEIRRESDPRFQAKLDDVRRSLGVGYDAMLEGETEMLDKFRSSMLQSIMDDKDEDQGPIIGDGVDEDFQLFVPEGEETDAAAPQKSGTKSLPRPGETIPDEAGSEPVDQPYEGTSNPSRRLTSLEISTISSQATKRRKRQKVTRHGTMVPSFPSSLIKRIATDTNVRNGRRRPQLGKDHMKALEQATEWFFEQVGEDLAAYAEHGRRKKRVDVSDARLLMRRQRLDLEVIRELAGEVLSPEVAAELDLADEDD